MDSVKRYISPDDYQSLLESLGLSGSGSTIDKRLKLPEISPSTESALEKAAHVATIGGGIANIWGNIGGSSSKREETEFDERAFKIPASVASWFKNLGNIGSIGAGGAAVVGALDSNSTLKRELDQAFDGVDLTALLNGATSQFEERGKVSVKPPAEPSVKPSSPETPSTSQTSGGGDILGKVASGLGALSAGTSILSAFNVTLKRELDQAFDGVDLTTLLNGATSQFEERGKVSAKPPAEPATKPSSPETPSTSQSSGGGDILHKVASGVGALSAGSSLLSAFNITLREVDTDAYGIGLEKPDFVETIPTFDERALKIPASVTTWLKALGNVGSIGAGGAAVVGAVDSGSNSNMKRETSDEVDLTTLLNGVAPQFEDRSVSSSEVSGFESALGKVATGATVAGTLATLWSALDPSSSSTTSKREFHLPGNMTLQEWVNEHQSVESNLLPAFISERSVISSAEGILAQLLGGILGGSGGISIKRSAYDSDPSIADVLTPEELQQVLTQMTARMVDLD